MKHLFILFSFYLTINHALAGGGCIPHAPTGTPGLTPSADSLPCIERTRPYRQVLYIENMDSINSSFGIVVVNFLRIDSITHLPSSMVWQANNSNNTYVGGEAGCIEIIGTTSDTVGTYQLGLYITIQMVIPILGVQTFSGEASALIAQFEALAGGLLGIDFSYFVTVINQFAPCRVSCTATSDTIPLSICDGDSFLAGGFYQTAPGFYVDSFTNSQGCDSLITTDLTVLLTSLTPLPVSICNGDSIFAEGGFQKNPGSYFDTLTGFNGCDSIVQTDLSIIPFYSVDVHVSICAGDSFFVGGAFQKNPAVYYDTLTSLAGCDSIIITDLSVIQPVFSNTSVTICPGDSIFAGGAFQKTPGLYYDTLTSFSGCDSVRTTNLSLSSTLIFNVPVSICTGDSIFAEGQYQTTTGIYYDTLTSPSGCDSVIITHLTVNSFIFESVQVDICDGGNHFAGGAFQTFSGTYYDTFPAVAGCDSIVETILTVHANPLVSFTTLNSTYCSNQPPIPLTGNPAAGSFSGTGLVGGSFDPSIVPIGIPVSITYSYTDSFGCSGSQTQYVTVLLPSSASFSGLDTQYCSDHEAVTLDGNPSGGIFRGPGISGSSFVPFFAGAGNHTITYTVYSSNGCTASDIKTVTVHLLPDLAFTGLDSSYCSNEDTILLNATPSGGTFSGAGVADSFFLPSLSGTGGPFIIEYSYIDSNTCENTISANIMVQPIPQLTFFGINPGYCLDDAPVSLNATPPGGNYFGPGIFGNEFVPDSAGVGSHTILYTYIGTNNCSNSISKQVQVNSSPSVTFGLADNEFCSGEPPVILSASPDGGIFSGAGVSLNVFTPDNSLAGDTPTITYEFTDLNGCIGSASVSAIVLASPDVQINGLNPVYCQDDLPATLLALPAGGTFVGAGISGDIFDPSAAGLGTHVIFYSFTDINGCYAETNQSVTVGCTGLANGINNELPIQVYPNPFKDEVLIHCNFEKNTVLKIRMMNIIGSEVSTEQKLIHPGTENFNLSFEYSLREGMYIIEISQGEKIFRTKLLKTD